ncbi:allantoate amidohydrolase [Sporolactobacillus sp. THM7-4]|nr:allantoate amidohydrolase [Sporolactobacillus sp. THM7-4]
MDVKSTPAITEEIDRMVEKLSAIGRTKNNGVTRLLYSPAWLEAQLAVKERMEDMGLSTYFDDVGNLFGRLEGTEKSSRVILTGSHIDTVVDGGKFDGAFGVIASMLAVSHLFQQYGTPRRTIEAVSLCEEEGSRFNLSFWGSGSITGKYRMKDAAELADSKGVPFVQAMNESGFGKGDYAQPERDDISCFLETHIEQGEILEREGKSWAAVSHIVGQRRYTVHLSGESNHAGTTPMNFRKDSLYAASQMIAHVVHAAKNQQNGLVATVGKIEADPNVGNVIAGECQFSLDIRHHEEDVLNKFCEETFREFKEIAEKENVSLQLRQWMDAAPVRMDPQLTRTGMELAGEEGIPFKKMISGAGHDSQVFGVYCPTALMFVPSHKGISHSPKEFTRTEDLEVGVRMLMKILYKLAYC